MSGLGHFGVGLAAKRTAYKIPLAVLLIAPMLLDIIWVVLSLMGNEAVVWSHGLLMSIVWSLAAATLTKLITHDSRTSLIIGLLVFSHWMVDFITHPMGFIFPNDTGIPLLFEGSPLVGLGLYNTLEGVVIGEALLIIPGIAIYVSASRQKATEPGRWTLFKLSGWAALIMVSIITAQFIIFSVWPPPLEGTALDWFRLFQDNWVLGLLSFEVLMVLYTILSIPVAFALYTALKRTDKMLLNIYLILTVIGIVAFIIARPAFEMLSLSKQYALAAAEEQKTMLLSAGQGLLAVFNGTAFHVSYILGSISGLIISIVMLKSNIFSKSTPYIRIMSSILDFGLYIPTIGIYISIFSVVFLFIWNILVALRLFKLAASLQYI